MSNPSAHERDIQSLADFLNGVAVAFQMSNLESAPFAKASRWLQKLREQGVCAEGVIGCPYGAGCTSDHK